MGELFRVKWIATPNRRWRDERSGGVHLVRGEVGPQSGLSLSSCKHGLAFWPTECPSSERCLYMRAVALLTARESRPSALASRQGLPLPASGPAVRLGLGHSHRTKPDVEGLASLCSCPRVETETRRFITPFWDAGRLWQIGESKLEGGQARLGRNRGLLHFDRPSVAQDGSPPTGLSSPCRSILVTKHFPYWDTHLFM